jgi:TonB family protein
MRINDMKAATLLFKSFTPAIVLSLLIGFGVMVSAPSIFGQTVELSLADILIALRSKKVTLPERNKILTDAVLSRGVTFSLTPEIEKELEATGADTGLVDAIRKKGVMVKTSLVVSKPAETKPNPVPASTPPPPDFNFYMNRAMSSSQKGDLDAALVDFGKAIEMKPESADAYLGRGMANLNKKALELAVADFSKAIELNPKLAVAFANRGDVYEKKGDVAKAKEDYKKALDLDANVEPAKSAMAKITADELKAQKEAEEARKAAEKPVVKEAPKAAPPEFVDLGQLYASQAVKLVTPIYSQVAIRAGIQGKVTVQITIDTEGNVTSAKAVDGHQFLRLDAEEAAKRSKFKPAMFDGKPIKAKGYIVYNFTAGK